MSTALHGLSSFTTQCINTRTITPTPSNSLDTSRFSPELQCALPPLRICIQKDPTCGLSSFVAVTVAPGATELSSPNPEYYHQSSGETTTAESASGSISLDEMEDLDLNGMLPSKLRAARHVSFCDQLFTEIFMTECAEELAQYRSEGSYWQQCTRDSERDRRASAVRTIQACFRAWRARKAQLPAATTSTAQHIAPSALAPCASSIEILTYCAKRSKCRLVIQDSPRFPQLKRSRSKINLPSQLLHARRGSALYRTQLYANSTDDDEIVFA